MIVVSAPILSVLVQPIYNVDYLSTLMNDVLSTSNQRQAELGVVLAAALFSFIHSDVALLFSSLLTSNKSEQQKFFVYS